MEDLGTACISVSFSPHSHTLNLIASHWITVNGALCMAHGLWIHLGRVLGVKPLQGAQLGKAAPVWMLMEGPEPE